jgi:LmbE family N-acetylglucosaminyl deacetylase
MTFARTSDAPTIKRIGAALREVSVIRQTYAKRQSSAGSPQRQRELAAQAQQEMENAVTAHDLSVQHYDQAMRMAQTDPQFKQRLLAAVQSAE